MAPEKTEAVLFFDKSRPDLKPIVRLRGTYVKMSPSMKYLGILLDSRLNFCAHFKYVQDKVSLVNRALFRLMPNLRGPSDCRRRLYSNVLTSIVMYGAPIWCDALLESKVSMRKLQGCQRSMAIRVCSAYRTTLLPRS